jgi:hypothetical protein
MYHTELEKTRARQFPRGFDEVAAAEVFAECLRGAAADHLRVLDETERTRIFNLGYFTWVEQQGVTLEEFTARRTQRFWQDLRSLLPVWDQMIGEFNARAGARAA